MARFTQGLLVCLMLLLSPGALAQQDGMLSGNLSSAGSDTLANLMALWGQDFSQHYPNVNLQVQAAGSSTAPTALATGAAQLGPMSRPMKAAEVAAFEQRYGYPPLAVPVAVDALVLLVHQDNPLPGLNLQQLDQIFSATRRCGESSAIQRWGELGLQGSWAQRTLQRFGRNSASGTYGYFKLRALCGGDFMARVNELPGSASVVQAVAGSVSGIGYASIGFRASGVRLLPLAESGDNYVMPTATNVRNGSYPLARYLYIYINKAPNQPLEPLTAAFLDRVLSQQGQALVNHDGYLPLPPDTLRKTRDMLGLE
ncbi:MULTISPECIES: PstS family phosphate ABC transporter substrate-binding protein [unclassified Serratia (in: enterobacteria)]|uniref:PstS family phosphate ABC transporter substrate-binding protein n=1 Tax=unclassified Serratia (in: enterobacteria) TaxID=2647522 RepID=UPI0005084C46|nr:MULTISPECIES: phosphate ABC transporter substrate-binding protein [unclassified Serratia (in: enterobacteria)]KFK97638.1 phosphate ABC transporter substrate-binding protein [Serratia sp. Ag2]KFK98007.1 phosphate ABC transporter substrate-binding protein [Serratia sp. Ag1]